MTNREVDLTVIGQKKWRMTYVDLTFYTSIGVGKKKAPNGFNFDMINEGFLNTNHLVRLETIFQKQFRHIINSYN
jgi:hypothetical protein